MRQKIIIFLFLVSSGSLFARTSDLSTNSWWTGSILSSPGAVVPPGHYTIEPYLFVNNNYGVYSSSWSLEDTPNFVSITPLLNFSLGLIEDWDFQVISQCKMNHFMGKSDTHFGDLYAKLGYQFIKADPHSWVPFVKLTLGEIFPTGNYQNLDPGLMGTDISGLGSYITVVGLNIQKEYKLPNDHPLRYRVNFSYQIPSPVKLTGANAFGGGFGTDGRVFPGQSFATLFSIEYGITRNWVFTIDVSYLHTNKDRFTGFEGTLFQPSQGELILAQVGNASSENISLAPAFEYNYDEHVGVIFGVWLSVAGRNSAAFFSPVIAINFFY